VGKSHVLKSRSGKAGGTWATPVLAVAYSKYLHPRFHAWANEVVLEYMKECLRQRGNAKVDRWRKKGQDDRWIQSRLEGIDIRKGFTDTLKEHGVEKYGYANCTDALYRELFGESAKVAKIQRGLSPKENLREHLDRYELAQVGFTEALAEKRIESADIQGNEPCKLACKTTAAAVLTFVKSVTAGEIVE
jgi:hypothetical protein